MNIAVLLHDHRFGVGTYIFKTEKKSISELPELTEDWAKDHMINFNENEDSLRWSEVSSFSESPEV